MRPSNRNRYNNTLDQNLSADNDSFLGHKSYVCLRINLQGACELDNLYTYLNDRALLSASLITFALVEKGDFSAISIENGLPSYAMGTLALALAPVVSCTSKIDGAGKRPYDRRKRSNSSQHNIEGERLYKL